MGIVQFFCSLVLFLPNKFRFWSPRLPILLRGSRKKLLLVGVDQEDGGREVAPGFIYPHNMIITNHRIFEGFDAFAFLIPKLYED